MAFKKKLSDLKNLGEKAGMGEVLGKMKSMINPDSVDDDTVRKEVGKEEGANSLDDYIDNLALRVDAMMAELTIIKQQVLGVKSHTRKMIAKYVDADQLPDEVASEPAAAEDKDKEKE